MVATHTADALPAQQALVRAVHARNNRTVVFAQRAPYDVNRLPEIGTAIATYEDRPRMLEAGRGVILGLLKEGGDAGASR